MTVEHSVVPHLVDPGAEGANPERRRELQQHRLRTLVDRLLAGGGIQAERLRAAGVRQGLDVSLGDLHRLPTVSKPDLWEHYPFGLRLAPETDIVCVHGSSGTGGRPTLIPYTAHDLDVWAQVMARALGGAGATRTSIIHCAYGYGLFTGGLGVHHGAIRLGATVVPMSGGMTDRQLRMLMDLRADVLCCTPSYAIHLGEALRASGVAPEELALRAGVFGAEPWTDGMRAQIEQSLGLRALDIYGLSEVIGPGVACESLDSEGMLNVAEDHFYVEAVDDEGRPVPDGTPGELVFTTLTKTGMPLLRYRTGDIARLAGPAPGSPRTLRRMSRLLGRRDDMLVVRGVNVFPSEIEAVLLSDERVAPHYLVVEDRRDPARPELRIAVEPFADSVAGDAAEALRRDLVGRLRERLGIGCVVTVLPPGGVPRSETGKARRLARWTGGEPPVRGLG
ncbi:phenylacetate-CoA ligase [Streptoalloteichus tenebrarius]|uniref:Phenylacetate-coenzyme A ligase n=1 Tax=Streptoalloteichus tenebrarius (strain ATCC 17920 / DSM 40477 / JCM 4838 / CBS 697.72 / NBRC 16177 / NCIMB 11028 / NRRL B-12390 / A12253. 1 / ISP 5477) TaxID=1933 RepID=A0ABT1I0V7_STRSD|nr:phenylacetate--CoA ligase [Streptoalloteichus tenebrarius]MCP2261368.1 phenylacetate-CoA ligase [Streptoalloteichus tenebrarius]BFF00908.1 phenylacetate--CoA ligase [Streptoalloteichus tenebrarius]